MLRVSRQKEERANAACGSILSSFFSCFFPLRYFPRHLDLSAYYETPFLGILSFPPLHYVCSAPR